MAVVAVVLCGLFLLVDLGHPERFWHLIPVVGALHWPASLLSWDLLVLAGYHASQIRQDNHLWIVRLLEREARRALTFEEAQPALRRRFGHLETRRLQDDIEKAVVEALEVRWVGDDEVSGG